MTPSRSLTTRAALAGLAGIGLTVALAGCTAAAEAEQPSSPETGGSDAGTPGADAPSDSATDAPAGSSAYADGDYTADGSYLAPSGQETVTVTLSLEGGVVTAVSVEGHAVDPEAREFQQRFGSGIADVVVGVSLDELQVSRVAGSSLTSGGFRAAVETIKSEARS